MDAVGESIEYQVFAAARDGKAITIYALLYNKNPAEVKDILDHITEEEGQKTTPFLISARNGHVGVIKMLLLQYKVDIEQVGTVKFDGYTIEGATALWCAAGAGHMNVVKHLLENDANVNHPTFSNSTPLRAACFDGRLSLVKYLIEHGADIHIPNKYKNTCLMIASYKGHTDVVQYLLQCGARPNDRAHCGATALHFAAERGHLDIVQLLVQYGSELSMNELHLSPLHLAAESSRADIVEFLISLPKIHRLEYIEALELLGASYANDKDHYDLEKCYHYLWLAMQERYKDEWNILLKKVLPPIEAYENRTECQTVAELETIKEDQNALHMEALIIRERILGEDNAEIPHPIVYRGAVFADTARFERCTLLWLRALHLRQKNYRSISKDLLRFAQVFSQMLHVGFSLRFNLVEQVFEKTLQEFENDKRRMQEAGSDPEEQKVVEETVEVNLHSALYLLVILSKVKQSSDEEFRLGRMAYCFNRIGLRHKPVAKNYTPLHMCCDDQTLVDDFHVNDVVRFPNHGLCQLLVMCGADVHAVDLEGNTPLHIIVGYNKPISDFLTLHNIIMTLIEAGAHMDRTNLHAQTALDLVTTGVAEIILRTKRKLELKCLAAAVVKKHNIHYQGQVPVTLEEFIEIH